MELLRHRAGVRVRRRGGGVGWRAGRREQLTPAALASRALLLLPGAAVVALAFAYGGFFPDATAAAVAVALGALLLWLLLAPDPFAGLSAPLAVGGAALAGLAAWTLASGAWSDAQGRAILEYDRLLLYVAALVLFGLVGRSAGAARWLTGGLAVAGGVVGVAALAVWLVPDLVTLDTSYNTSRLSWPLSYWNGMGLLLALAVVWNVGLACDDRARLPLRLFGALVTPMLAAALFFTLSRGAAAALAVGLVAYLLAARPRDWIPGLLATAPTTVVGVLLAYRSDWTLESPAADEQTLLFTLLLLGVGGALVLGAAVHVQARHAAGFLRPPAPPRGVQLGALAAVLVAVTAYAVVDGAGRAAGAWDDFASASPVPTPEQPGRRFLSTGGAGRVDHWEVAWDSFTAEPLRGTGAGTFVNEWSQHRDTSLDVLDAHSLYLETLGELGLVGALLLAVALGATLVALAARSRGPDRAVWGTLFAAVVVWAVHAGADWDWEVPALTAWVFAAGGLALAAPRREAADGDHPRGAPRGLRVALGVGCLLLAIVPVLVHRSQTKLDEAVTALRANDCPRAIDAALDATDALGARPEPYEVLAYCDIRIGEPALALRAVDAAVERDPHSWELRYASAIVRGAAGQDPRPAARRAFALNPRNPLAQDVVRRFDVPRRRWRERALAAPLPLPEVSGTFVRERDR